MCPALVSAGELPSVQVRLQRHTLPWSLFQTKVPLGINPCGFSCPNFGSLPLVSLLHLMIFRCGFTDNDVVTARGWLKIKDSRGVLLSDREEMMRFRVVLLFQGSLLGPAPEKR